MGTTRNTGAIDQLPPSSIDESSPSSTTTSSITSCWSCCMSAATTKKSPLTARIISGSIGSIITSLVVTPLEVAKIRTQTSLFSGRVGGGGGDGISTTNNPVVAKTRTLGSSKIQGPPRIVASFTCPKGCMVLFNGHMDCLVTKESFPSVFYPANHHHVGVKTPAAVASSSTTTGTGVFSVMRKIYFQEGFAGIYAGLRPTLLMAIPNTVLYFSIYEELIWRFRHNHNAIIDSTGQSTATWYYPLVAGAVARTVASSATAPFEYIRTRQAANGAGTSTGATTMYEELQAIIRTTDGTRRTDISALYQGLRPTLWRDVPFSAIYWFCIEELRARWKERQNSFTISPVEQAGQEFVNGALSGMVAAAFTTPFDVVKTRQQTSFLLSKPVSYQPQAATAALPSLCSHSGGTIVTNEVCSFDGVAAGGPTKPIGTFQTMRQIVLQEGWTSLWRGNQARMLKVAPSCAIMLSTYELGKRIL